MSLALGNLIGFGGFGSVYRAKMNGRVCAAKECHISSVDPFYTKVMKEIKVLRDLRHRHVITYYDTVEQDDHTYIVMDLAERGCLAGAIDRGEVSDWPTKKRISHEIALGLTYIHSVDILHRDLKTENVLLTHLLEAKLCDFGLAKTKSISSMRSTSTFKGTLRWAAPEALDLKYTDKSDVYALGMIMWAMAANQPAPFVDLHDNEIIVQYIKRGKREAIPDDTPLEYRDWI